ncbi:Probable ubiquitin receptor [Seminavis robusta]|uniref:Probable ubiquitin receptor n=1 Tax=Seminavis robusta TaxID=568900 RepID=A0A9N8DMR5_9STRA|nr:Probable ubiquitin receptor [Seminavis robusta]|eukprot:Sro219_g090420.1 Probable ubiquitin receptor (455) ;mRNA; r:38338-39968
MKLLVKTLKGEKFHVECEPTHVVSEVKAIVEKAKPELAGSTMKLIHSGRVLKDDSKVEECNIKPTDFLVVMVTKAKKPAAAPAAAAPAPAAEPKTPAPATAPAAATTTTTTTASTATTPAASSSTETPAAPARPSGASEFPDEVVSNLTGMGFPEAEVRHCLRAANGNPDIAMEFLTNGIPPGVEAAASGAPSPVANAGSGAAGGLESFRNHPQINQLRRLVQTNPHMLQTVLAQIGQQQPDLLQAINQNQAAFLAMMNEPVTDAPAPAANSGSSSGASSAGAGAGGPAGMLEGMANPAQMAQMIQSMSPAELNQMAAMMGLSADQLRQTAQMLGQIPPEQLQQYMMQAMGGGGMGDMAGLMGAAGAGEGGPQVLRLNEEEMAAVNRLTEMGFDRAEAAQAFLACDKNEALAANLLMDGGFGFGGDSGAGSGGSNGNSNNNGGSGDNDDDAMYD